MISVFDLFSVGVGPSSSHTVGPMRAARRFVQALQDDGLLDAVHTVVVELYGSLALTGKGHGTDYAVLMGLEGCKPETVDPAASRARWDVIVRDKTLSLLQTRAIAFAPEQHLLWHGDQQLPGHPNGLCVSAYTADQQVLCSRVYYSIGGGFVVDQDHDDPPPGPEGSSVPCPFDTAHDLLMQAQSRNWTIAQVVQANEQTWRDAQAIASGVMGIWSVMEQSIEAGCRATSRVLPGGLSVPRRAPDLYRSLQDSVQQGGDLHTDPFHWLNLYAIAVNEENAAGGRVVTAPTNGAAGIVPAVFRYYLMFHPGAQPNDFIPYLLTATAVGVLYKQGASISAAEMGCQGEVGVACSMAAAGLAALWGGTPSQVENAAEIGMEHHLGLTCDPIKGLVQIPCIERNAMGAVQAVGAAKLALMGSGTHRVSLDDVIATMRQTGLDMSSKYKETSQGGLAVNVPAC